MTRWQYHIVNLRAFHAKDRLVRALGALGKEGWELVAIYDKSSNWLAGMEKGFALFKRPVADGAEPEGPWAEATLAKSHQAGIEDSGLGPAIRNPSVS
jgi:hypothetical protein